MAATLTSRGFDVRPLIIDDIATTREVEALETTIGFAIPAAYREALLTISRHVEFRWFAPHGREFGEPLRGNFSGDLHWSLDLTSQFIKDANAWVDEVFPDASDPYDAVWHQKAAFYEVGNGDYLAFDLTDPSYGSIVYLSHDDGEGHGHVLATNFADLLDRWIPLACTGGEDWQWIPFTSGLTTLIEPHGDMADLWREGLGLRQ